MKKVLCSLTILVLMINVQQVFAQTETFAKRTVASGFNSAWEVVYGPNDSLWVTENKAYIISRVNIANGNKTQLVNLRAKIGRASCRERESRWVGAQKYEMK